MSSDYELSSAELDWVEHLQDTLERLENVLTDERAIPGLAEFAVKLDQYLIREYSRRRRAEKLRLKSG